MIVRCFVQVSSDESLSLNLPPTIMIPHKVGIPKTRPRMYVIQVEGENVSKILIVQIFLL